MKHHWPRGKGWGQAGSGHSRLGDAKPPAGAQSHTVPHTTSPRGRAWRHRSRGRGASQGGGLEAGRCVLQDE